MRIRIYLFGLAFAAGFLQAASTPQDFYQAIRQNDLTQIRAMLAEGTSANLRDPKGNTPLMHAAAIGSLDAMRLLMKAGADANAANDLNVTPLVLCASNLDKVQLLVGAGAKVDVVTKLRRTPLIVASGVPAATPIVKLLLEKGADTAIADVRGTTALVAAAGADNLDAVRLLLEKPGDLKAVNVVGLTALHLAAGHSNVPMVKLLLAKGIDVNIAPKTEIEVKNGLIALSKLTPLMVAAPRSSLETVRVLLAAGADVKAKDVRGMTALMMAVASDSANPEVVRLLIEKGSDASVTSTDGETVLDWARKFGDSRILSLLGAPDAPMKTKPKVLAVSDTALTPRLAIERANTLLASTSKEYFRMSGCTGCHHQPVIAMAAAAARKAGFPIEEAFIRDQSLVLKADMQTGRVGLQQDLFISADSMAYTLLGLSGLNYPADDLTDTVVSAIAARQTPEGDFLHVAMARPPLEDSQFVAASLIARAIQQYTIPARKEELEMRVVKIRNWLTAHQALTPYEQAFRLMGLSWSGADSQTVSKAADQVLRMQHADGGWPQLATLESDAFGTAAALYALRRAGGPASSSPAYQRGIQYLLQHQQSDGSWHVASRSPKIQPYFLAGFPHQHDQWISAAATALAMATLSESLPPGAGTVASR